MHNKQINCNEKQLLLICEAVEFYHRFMSGQLDALPNELKFRCDDKTRLSQTLAQLKTVLFPELFGNEAYGVGAPTKTLMPGIHLSDREKELRDISYEIYRQLYVHFTAERKAAGGDVSYSVYDYPTMRYSGEPLIEITYKTEENVNDLLSAVTDFVARKKCECPDKNTALTVHCWKCVFEHHLKKIKTEKCTE